MLSTLVILALYQISGNTLQTRNACIILKLLCVLFITGKETAIEEDGLDKAL